MKFQSMFRSLSGFFALAVVLFISSSTGSAQSSDSDKISDLLLQAENHAMIAQNEAALLESYTGSKVSWQSHGTRLRQMKDHVNELGSLNKQLSDLRSEGSPWQQTAIDQVDTRLREVADLLSATIMHMSDNPSQIHFQTYRDYVRTNYELISDPSKMIGECVDYDQAKSKAEALEQQLNLAAAQDSV